MLTLCPFDGKTTCSPMASSYYQGIQTTTKMTLHRESVSDNLANWLKIVWPYLYIFHLETRRVHSRTVAVLEANGRLWVFPSRLCKDSVLVRVYSFGEVLCVAEIKGESESKSPDELNEAWVIVKTEGDIISAHCTCMAGYVIPS